MARIVTTLPYTEYTTASGNYDESRAPIDRVIIHTTDGTLQSAISRFSTIGTVVSAHYIIDTGGRIYHGLEETFTAYQAGDYAMNQRSIGIEHVDNGDYNGIRPDSLYTASASLVRDICQYYNIPIDRQHILKHSEVIATGCPDALDIERIVREASLPVLIPPNPGYMPTFEGQTVTKDGITYQSYKDPNGTLLWKIATPIPEPPTMPPDGTITPLPPTTPPIDYKNYLVRIKAAMAKGWFWQKLSSVNAIIKESGV